MLIDLRGTAVPASFELVPGQLWGKVWPLQANALGQTYTGWVYVSEGLASLRQRELVFALTMEPGEQAHLLPAAPLQFFSTVHGLARSGKLVNVGDYSEFGPNGFLGDTRFRGMLYGAPQNITGVPVSPDALSAILLTEEELVVAKEHGATRVFAKFGRAFRSFPFPAWSMRGRNSVTSLETLQGSLLGQVPRLVLPLATIRQDGQHVRMAIPMSAHGRIQGALAQLPQDMPLILFTQIDPMANGLLTWRPGITEPEAIAPPGGDASRLAGGFLAVVPMQNEDTVKILEDGFMVVMTPGLSSSFRQALQYAQPVSLPVLRDGMSFSLEWLAGQ